ncbi:MAG: hypothetical protein ACLR7Z_17330 [Bilophila wadsworthia]
MTDEEDAHEWRTPDNAMKDGLTVGAVAGTPWVAGTNCAATCSFPTVTPSKP